MGGGGEYTKKDIKKNGESGDGRHRESNERGEMVGEETKRKTEREGGSTVKTRLFSISFLQIVPLQITDLLNKYLG